MIKLISINIEGDKHLERVLPFIEKERPDVLCLQEVLERDVPLFERAVGGEGQYVTMGILPGCRNSTGLNQPTGIGIFSSFPLTNVQSHWYFKNEDAMRSWDDADSVNRLLLVSEFKSAGKKYVIGTTHFTLTPDGRPNERQLRHLEVLLGYLSRYSEMVLAGDFNAPRGLETFRKLAEKYKDNIPLEYDTSLDPDLHVTKGKLIKYMVDGLFTSPHYEAKEARLQFGVSDHAAIVTHLRYIQDTTEKNEALS